MVKRNFAIRFFKTIGALSVAAVLFLLPVGRTVNVYAAEEEEIVSVTTSEQENGEENAQEEESADPETAALNARRAKANADPDHVHNYEWIAMPGDSEVADGYLCYMCYDCGKVMYFRPIHGFYAFQGSVAARIRHAEKDAHINVVTTHYITFRKEVMQALSDRSDVSLTVSFFDKEYKGNRYRVTVPAGYDSMSLLDDNGYCGFLYLGSLFGLTLEKAEEIPEASTDEQVTETTDESSFEE